MFSMTIIFGDSPTPWTLLYKTKESFDTARTAYNTPALSAFDGKTLDLADDYGQQAVIRRESIHGVLFEDLNQSMLGAVERGLHQLRTQIAANKAGRADPSIMEHMRQQQHGPAVLAPGFNGGFRQ
jgi:hypothetical protein